MSTEGHVFQFARLGVKAAPQTVDPNAEEIELLTGPGTSGVVRIAPGHIVVVAPDREQGINRIIEHRVQHRKSR